MATNSDKQEKWRGRHDLKVIGAGFSRTGSYSLKMALEQLGFRPCWHIIDIMADDDKANALMWWRNIDKKIKTDKYSIDFDEFYKELANGAQAAVDWPTFFYWEEIAEYYPNCKLILTIRDKERWYKSCLQGLNLYFYNPILRIFVFFGLVDIMTFIARELLPKSVEEFGGIDKFYNDKQAVFNKVDERIKYMTTNEKYKDRVLIFSVKDGWPKLCEFLNVDIPKNTPFPRSNDSSALAKNTQKFVMQNVKRYIINHTFLFIFIIVILILLIKKAIF